MIDGCLYTLGSAVAQLVLLAQEKGAKPPAAPALPLWPMWVAIGILFWVLVMRPNPRQREHARMLEALKQNDRVVTTGGIAGTVVNASKDSEYIVIRVDESNNTRLRVLRSAIMRVESEEKKEGDKDK